MNDVEKGRIGSSFEGFLHEEGTYTETTEQAVKRVAELQKLVDEGRASGVSNRSMDDIWNETIASIND